MRDARCKQVFLSVASAHTYILLTRLNHSTTVDTWEFPAISLCLPPLAGSGSKEPVLLKDAIYGPGTILELMEANKDNIPDPQPTSRTTAFSKIPGFERMNDAYVEVRTASCIMTECISRSAIRSLAQGRLS